MKLFAFVLAAVFSFGAYAGELTLHTTVIAGKFGRGGSTNRQPLGDASLKQLCEQGYTLAMFLYPGAPSKTVSCGGGKTIRYMSKTGYSSPSGILAAAQAEINAGGKVFVHCWYGVHAAKFVSAAALNKFCGWNGNQAADYFVRGIPRGSLSEAKINELAGKLRAYGSGGSVIGGCPSP